jgi:3alpha(or 20beta)-hydroxysteroid dehydrogenase
MKGKVAIVTGGSRSLGAATSQAFAAAGATVIVASRGAEQGEAFARTLGPNAHYMRLDVTSEREWETLIAETMKRFGRVDALVNNAGLVGFGAIDDIRDEDIDRLFTTNFKGTLYGMRHAGRAMKAAKRGAIVNIISIDSTRGVNGLGAYAASKAAVGSLTRTAAMEFAPYGVRVNAINPGTMVTDMSGADNATDEHYAHIFPKLPLGRMGNASEIAAAAIFLCSDAASYICGVALPVDGGWLAGVYYPELPGLPPSHTPIALPSARKR